MEGTICDCTVLSPVSLKSAAQSKPSKSSVAGISIGQETSRQVGFGLNAFSAEGGAEPHSQESCGISIDAGP